MSDWPRVRPNNLKLLFRRRAGRCRPLPGTRNSLPPRSEEHTSELQSLRHLVCRLLLEKKKETIHTPPCADAVRLPQRGRTRCTLRLAASRASIHTASTIDRGRAVAREEGVGARTLQGA